MYSYDSAHVQSNDTGDNDNLDIARLFLARITDTKLDIITFSTDDNNIMIKIQNPTKNH